MPFLKINYLELEIIGQPYWQEPNVGGRPSAAVIAATVVIPPQVNCAEIDSVAAEVALDLGNGRSVIGSDMWRVGSLTVTSSGMRETATLRFEGVTLDILE